MQQPASIDAYIGQFEPAVQAILQQLRATIRTAAPNAEEANKYGIPNLVLPGNLLHFGAFKKHVSFFPGGAVVERFAGKLAGYQMSKGTIRFSLAEPIPFGLVAEIVKFRLQQNELKRQASKKKK